jgi:hypothetical protein
MTRISSLLQSLFVAALIACTTVCQGFVMPSSATAASHRGDVSVKAMPHLFTNAADAIDMIPNVGLDNGAVVSMVSSSMMVSETEAWVQPMSLVLGPILSLLSIGMVRVLFHVLLFELIR